MSEGDLILSQQIGPFCTKKQTNGCFWPVHGKSVSDPKLLSVQPRKVTLPHQGLVAAVDALLTWPSCGYVPTCKGPRSWQRYDDVRRGLF